MGKTSLISMYTSKGMKFPKIYNMVRPQQPSAPIHASLRLTRVPMPPHLDHWR